MKYPHRGRTDVTQDRQQLQRRTAGVQFASGSALLIVQRAGRMVGHLARQARARAAL
jgi:hypothetical protein